jgi:DNA polymerase-3 subunit alpha
MAAMYRPGPMDLIDDYIAVKHKKKKATYEHPVMEELLTATNGIMVYQEQVMQMLNQLGNIPLGDAYACIKAISRKRDFSKYREDFVAGAKKNGLAETKANSIFDLICEFAKYGFNKSHATAYALEAYFNAYMKTHYPVEYMAALLCGDLSDRNLAKEDDTVVHIRECKRMGIELIPPDVNTSTRFYSVVDGNIAFALTAIKGCGDWAADKIVEAREKGGTFKSLFDFCARVDNRACNRAAIESLIKAGAFDSLGCKRSQLFQAVDFALKAGQSAAEDAAKGQGNLFGAEEDDEPEVTVPSGLPDIPEWTDKEKAIYEKEVLGFYISAHPLQEYTDIFANVRSHECLDAPTLPDKTSVVLAGKVCDLKVGSYKAAKTGNVVEFARFALEGASGVVQATMWADAYERLSHLVKEEAIVVMRGRMNRRKSASDESADGNFTVDEAWAIGMAITMDEERHTDDSVSRLLQILQNHPGNGTVELSLRLKDGAIATFHGNRIKARVTPALQQQITELLGTNTTRIGEIVAKRGRR